MKDPIPKADMLESNIVYTKYRLRVWCDRDDYFDIQPYLIESVKSRFDAAGVSVVSK